jgi:integrase
LYYPAKEAEDFKSYIYHYRDVLTNKGFSVKKKVEYNGFKKERIAYRFNTVRNPSSDFEALESYFRYIHDEDANPNFELTGSSPKDFYLDKLDYRALERSAKEGKGSGYGLKARGIMKKSLAKKFTIFSKLANSKKHSSENKGNGAPKDNKAFPIEAFDRLLEISKYNPRVKLLYLLCGATSARLGQALSLTFYDIDLESRHVYLNDPRSSHVPFTQKGSILLSQPPRRKLLLNKGIDAEIGKYKYVGFKHPIPSLDDSHRSLYFLADRYEDMFYDTYRQLKNEVDMSYPFVFQTANSTLWLPSNAQDRFKSDLKKLDKLYPQFNILNLTNSFHSLRHMYGRTMANYAYYMRSIMPKNGDMEAPDGKIVNIFDIWKVFTRKKMGHASAESTDIYFNQSRHIDNFAIELIKKNQKEIDKIKKNIIEAVESGNNI